VELAQDDRFRSERARYSLRFTCEHCAIFDPVRAGCAHGYPTAPHRTARYDSPDAPIVFCKDFEMV
jgi:hypothetical protein